MRIRDLARIMPVGCTLILLCYVRRIQFLNYPTLRL